MTAPRPAPGNSPASRDIAYHVHGYTNLAKHEKVGPQIVSRGNGIHIYDDAGKEYIEGLAGLWAVSLGFSERRLIDAATRELSRLPNYHGFAHKTPDVTIDLAEKILELAPVPMSKVLFANSGSEAIDLSIKLVWYVNNARGKPEKKKLIARQKGYHGVTVAGASLTGLPHLHGDFDLPIARVLHTDCPHHYRFAEDGEDEQAFATRCADNLEKLILAEGPETVAAFYAEPVMGAGGVIVPPKGYFEKIQAVLKRHDVMLIADEVICGFGRTGNMWGSTTFGMKSDMVTMAKALTSGYIPMSALMISEEIYRDLVRQSEAFGVFGHGSTYAGHPVAAAVALETLAIYAERDMVGHVQSVSPVLQQGLRAFKDRPLVGEVRGIGLIGAIELVRDKDAKAPWPKETAIGAKCQEFCYEEGLVLRAVGDSIAFCPPLIATAGDVNEILSRFDTALKKTEAWAERQNG
ncbi:MAG: aspartate aminotransferase family protein [Rhodospirillales bacterium CG15_BIG_FIL_POST_REV_8_21_14_020_66_15]|nr:MAG: aspartate aminotransferase family protein [Rhodospirillales bacterium CG15_BIG_FIL_POST_REV_8_21_14_020_66_15]